MLDRFTTRITDDLRYEVIFCGSYIATVDNHDLAMAYSAKMIDNAREAAEARATELAAQLNQSNAYLQSAIEERNRAEFELSSARNTLRDIANGKYADPQNFAAVWINAHSFEPDVKA